MQLFDVMWFGCVGIHPTTISEAFQRAAVKSCSILEGISVPVQLSDRESLLKSATTSLNSKVLYSPVVYIHRWPVILIVSGMKVNGIVQILILVFEVCD